MARGADTETAGTDDDDGAMTITTGPSPHERGPWQ